MFEFKDYLSRYNCQVVKSTLVGGDNLLSYYLLKKPFLGPLYVGWNVTFRCNCKCSLCQSGKFVDRDKELSEKECLGIIRELGKARICLLSITGGEPLLREDLYKIIKEAKRYDISVNLLTNGALLAASTGMLIEAGVDTITISIDSFSPEAHDLIRQHPGLFQKVETGIKSLRRMRKNNKPRIVLGVTVSKKNYNSLGKIEDYWKDKVDEFIFQPITDSSLENIFQVTDRELLFNPEDRERFSNSFNNFLEEYRLPASDYEKEFLNFFFNKTYLEEKYKCYAGFFMLQIDAYGNVYPCPEFVTNFGNLREKSFTAIWKGRRAQGFRKYIKQGRNSCFCWYRCTGMLNCYLTKLTNR